MNIENDTRSDDDIWASICALFDDLAQIPNDDDDSDDDKL